MSCTTGQSIGQYNVSAVNPCNPSGSIGSYVPFTNSCLSRSGQKPKSTTWTFTIADIPEFSQPNVKGELNFYMQDGSGYAGFVQGALCKINNKITAQIYQRNGNLTSLPTPTTTYSDKIVYTITPAVYGYWTFRGI